MQIWSRPKSSQVNASARKAWPNGVARRPKFSTCYYLQVCLTRALNLEISCCYLADDVKELYLSACRTCSTIIFRHSTNQGPVVRSLVSANRWLRGIKTYRFPWYLTLVSANHASSNPGQIVFWRRRCRYLIPWLNSLFSGLPVFLIKKLLANCCIWKLQPLQLKQFLVGTIDSQRCFQSRSQGPLLPVPWRERVQGTGRRGCGAFVFDGWYLMAHSFLRIPTWNSLENWGLKSIVWKNFSRRMDRYALYKDLDDIIPFYFTV